MIAPYSRGSLAGVKLWRGSMEHHAIESVEPVRRRGRVALLVDGDNIAADRAGALLTRAGRLGTVAVKRVYVDPAHLPNWVGSAGFSLVASRPGRGASDLMLAIEAVDLFHTGDLAAVAIASTDGGFAALARFLVERGLEVLGIGAAAAPADCQRSCSRFEILPAAPRPCPLPQASDAASPAPKAATADQPSAVGTIEDRVVALLRASGPTPLRLSEVGSRMKAIGVSRSDLGAGSWVAWVRQRDRLFDLDGAGPGLQVQLRRSA